MPKTSANATPRTISRRVQYTRAGSRPRGRPGHAATLSRVPAVHPRLPHRRGPTGDGRRKVPLPGMPRPRSRRPTSTAAAARGTTSTPATCPGAEPTATPWGGAGQRVHAAADAGRPGAAGLRAWLRALADARPTWRPSPPARRSGPGAGSATRGARCGCTRRRPRSPSGTAARCPTPTTSCSRCPGVGDYTAAAVAGLRVRPAARRARHQRAPGARPGRGRRGVPADGRDRGRAGRRGRRCCPTTSRPPPPGRSPRWSSAPWSAPRPRPRCAACPVARPVRVARRRLPGVRRTAAARADLRRHRPAVPRPAAGAAARHRRAGAPQRGSTRPGRDAEQRDRCLSWLVDDGLVVAVAERRLRAARLSVRRAEPGSSARARRRRRGPRPSCRCWASRVERQVELEAHERGVDQGRRLARAAAGHPDATRWSATRRHPHRVGLAHHGRVGLAPEQPERRGLDVQPLAALPARPVLTRRHRSSTAARRSGDGGSARMLGHRAGVGDPQDRRDQVVLVAKW